MRRLLFWLPIVFLGGCGAPAPVEVPEAVKLETYPPGYHELSTNIDGVGTVRYALQVPENYDGTKPVPLVLLLHYGYDGPTPDPYTGGELSKAFAPGLAALNAIVIAPDVVGGNWTSPKNEKAAIFLTRSALKSFAIDPKKVVVAGFSMGGAGTWFLGSRHSDLFTGAIPVAAPLAGDDKDWKIPAYVIHSQNDESVPYQPAKNHAESLAAKGANVKFQSISGLTHFAVDRYADYLGDAVVWLESQWAK